ncbi:MAG: hypothetical protein WCP79_00115 [Bacillota bacterium]
MTNHSSWFKVNYTRKLQHFAAYLVPPIMTLVEATAPHSMDTPMMMIIGFLLLYAICLFN